MKKGFWYFFTTTILLSCYLLAGCSAKTQHPSMEATSKQVTESSLEERNEVDSSELSSSLDATQVPPPSEPETSGEFDFRYIHRGFTAVPLNDSEMLERFRKTGSQIIETEEGLYDFTASYCPGIPYDGPWDFSKDYLVGYITEAAIPAYTNSNTITRMVWEDGRFVPEYENDPANYFYALNTEEYTHFFVEIVAISRDSNGSEGVHAESAAPEWTGSGLPFQNVFQGFAMASLEDRDEFERYAQFGARIIATEKDWDAFVSAFCPGLPHVGQLDFASNSLYVSIMLGARPSYAIADPILGVYQEDGYLTTERDSTKRLYALNTADHTHFYVEVIAVPSEQIPYNINTWTN